MKLKKIQHLSSSKNDIAVWADQRWKIIEQNSGELLDYLKMSIDDLQVSVFINDQRITSNSSKGKKYSFQEAIAYASWEEQLHPGELFGSGTIPSCTGIENGIMLHKGDLIKLEVDHIGILKNVVE